jgi:hypothetical protein
MSEFAGRARTLMRRALARVYRLSDPEAIPEVRQWFTQVTATEPDAELKEIGLELSQLFLEFQMAIFAPELAENQSPSLETIPTFYEQVRLFMWVLDKAVTGLPWAKLTRFAQDVIGEASDLSLGQRPGFQHFMFKSPNSPFMTVTHDFLEQTQQGVAPADRRSREALLPTFRATCEGFLKPFAKGERP